MAAPKQTVWDLEPHTSKRSMKFSDGICRLGFQF